MIGPKILQKLIDKIPSNIRITHNISYEIVYIDEFPNDPKQVGEMRPDVKQIVIKKGQSKSETLKTFIHELIHAISEENKIKITELQTSKLEDSLFRVFKLNNILELLSKLG